MTPPRTHADDRVEHLVRMQREMSRSRTVPETVREFLRINRAVSPADWMVYAMVWPPRAAPGTACRVVFDGPLGDEELHAADMAAMLDDDCERFPLVEGGLLAELAGRGPVIIDDLAIDPDDPGLGPLAGRMRSLVAVPIYWQGEVENWCVMLSERPGAFDRADLHLILANANMLARSVTHLATLERVGELAERLEGQLQELARVQRSLLPAAAPDVHAYDIATSYKPSLHAGGDYYDFRSFSGGRLGVIIADVSGHGAAAAAVMAIMRTAMHTLSESGLEVEFVRPVNRILRSSVSERTFVTAFFLSLQPETGQLACVDCGHPPPRIRRASGEIVPLSGEGLPPLGILEYDRVPEIHDRLDPGDALVLYTDGVTEAFDDERRMFGVEGLDDAIRAGASAHAVVQAIESRVNKHTPIPDDDQTIVAIRRRDTHG